MMDTCERSCGWWRLLITGQLEGDEAELRWDVGYICRQKPSTIRRMRWAGWLNNWKRLETDRKSRGAHVTVYGKKTDLEGWERAAVWSLVWWCLSLLVQVAESTDGWRREGNLLSSRSDPLSQEWKREERREEREKLAQSRLLGCFRCCLNLPLSSSDDNITEIRPTHWTRRKTFFVT